MGSAYYIVLERDIEGLDVMMDGKRLARNIELFDAAAQNLGVRPLSEFVSIDPDEALELLDGADDIELPELEQFSAQDGLATVRALLPLPEAQPAAQDLKDCERILTVAGWPESVCPVHISGAHACAGTGEQCVYFPGRRVGGGGHWRTARHGWHVYQGGAGAGLAGAGG
jgi:hypothetical protein